MVKKLVVAGGERAFFGDLDSPDKVPKTVIDEISKVITNNTLWRYQDNQNSQVAKLEKSFAEHLGVKYALAVNSCTSAIMLSLLSLRIHRGDKILMPVFTFVAAPSAISNLDAKPVLVEIDKNYCIDIQDLEEKMTENPDARILLLTHMRGHVSDMDKVVSLCRKYGVHLVEDCAHSLGAKYDGIHSGTFGNTGCFSFQSYKIINAGEGGMLVTNDDEIYIKSLLLSGCFEGNHKFHNINEDNSFFLKKYINTLPIYNFRMSEITGVIVMSQMDLIEEKIKKYTNNYKVLRNVLSKTDLVVFPQSDGRTNLCNDTVQFRIPDFSEQKIKIFIDILKLEGISVSCFSEEGNVRYYKTWRFLNENPKLPKTHDILSSSCEIRLPYELTVEDVELIGNILLEAVKYVSIEKDISPGF